MIQIYKLNVDQILETFHGQKGSTNRKCIDTRVDNG